MARNVKLSKSAFNTTEFDRVVDREFKTFKKTEPAVDRDTVEELFRLYDKLYFTIPLEGNDNSHTFLLEQSSKLVDFNKTTEEIQPLLDEITQLRQQLVNANEIINELESELASNGAV
tara:strand:+ start:450 stop:803 length:354 start_codon:yes stop_codon:yes gene_type:complete